MGRIVDALVTTVLGIVGMIIAFLIVVVVIIGPFIAVGAGLAFGVWIVLKLLGVW